MKMFAMNPRFLLLSVLLVLLAINLCESSTAKNRNRKKQQREKEQKEINVCDIEQENTPLYCYCNDNKLASAEDANCLIFNKLELSDPIWAHFNAQMYIRKLSFVVRSDGMITYVPTGVLRQLKSLNAISFQHAKFDAIESQSFASLPSVSTINLNKNNINVLKWHSFEGLRNLTLLNLDENYISELSRDIFYDVPRLQKLFLNHNNISLLHDKAFKHLPSLQELELNDNKLSVLTSESFSGLRLLQRLDLRNNQIRMLGERSFIEMPELQELDLDQNRIEVISNRAFDGLKNLRKLRLSENKLSVLEPDFLIGAPSINLLDLRENELTTMTFDNIKPVIMNFYNNSSYFYLDGNKLICDCKLTWIWGLRNETKNAKLREGLEELTCLLEASYDVKLDSGEDMNRALDVVRNPGYHIKGNMDDPQYLGDNNYDDDYADNDYPAIGHAVELNGKRAFVRHIFELKPDKLPCPAASREDVMASEQPSGRHQSSSIFSFVSGASSISLTTGLLVIAFALLT
ncbi:connectin [Nasonia vitripennis]|uniref:Connectin n=1 Tax=Nasonia vitripennis TaxID=7425 RepID=A0A7M7QC38_NASVI|nr:connectin [Nasonia vitripennis]XP_016842072.1 connectin [Nasonia vitripennis]XP_031784204.1 connectin [Nasonia vitripennis]XP_031784205.1 connectin [Nasonia vitripennis]XP_031784206.1 connectin [Nasonia vitripennis]XP_031784207.1 connectin [Nasonia vitripennis]XP_031784208.1 connectin [Nasonia vitripennis]XP_031784209.1 connectin [Nasonia vitripennis]XP_032457884.1 connectin [Nasonia vitripennis]XP_032457885.1 connectin [Nasonia vitripennis]XP_032457886.1 connectin [Nasonia vitripennis